MAKPHEGQSSIYLRQETLRRLRIAITEKHLDILKAGVKLRRGRTQFSYDELISELLDERDRNG